MVLSRPGYAALLLVWLAATPAMATTIEGVDFTDPISVEVPSGTNLLLTTSEDVYIYAPNGLFADTVNLIAVDMIVINASINANSVALCDDPSICPTGDFDLADDVVVTVIDPVGSFHIEAGGSIVLSTTPIPEPSTALLVQLGLLALAVRRRAVRRASF